VTQPENYFQLEKMKVVINQPPYFCGYQLIKQADMITDIWDLSEPLF